MSKFTPGPWFASSERGYGDLSGIQICGSRGYCLAVAIGDVPELPVEANAHLMAAAPEMFAALKDALLYMEVAQKIRQPDWGGYATPDSAIGSTRAALAKARGETP